MATVTVSQEVAEDNALRRARYHEADVVVVGAGVFGCAIAHALARQGRSVLLLERWLHEPDRIVGELMQPGGVAELRKLGLAHCLDDIDAVPCYGMNVIYHGNECVMTYPRLGEDGEVVYSSAPAAEYEAAKRPEGRSFHHGRFITQLRKTCAASEHITMVETEAMRPIRGEVSDRILGVEARTVNPETGKKEPDYFFGKLTIAVDGYDSRFREAHLRRKPMVRSRFYALELIDCPLPHPNFGNVVIGKAFPVLLYQIGTHETRILIDVPINLPAAAPAAGGVKSYIRNVVIPALPEQLRPSVQLALDTNRLQSMPNSWLPPTRQRANGLIVLGDAMNMRHPLTGGGMTVALNDARLLSELLSPERIPDLSDVPAVQSALNTFHWSRKNLTSIINVLAMALYSLFAADDRHLRALQRGCFRYFELGRFEDPMGLLGGLIRKPMVLASHFFTVAFLAIWVNALQIMASWGVLGFLLLPWALIDGILVLWRASIVFLPVFGTELR